MAIVMTKTAAVAPCAADVLHLCMGQEREAALAGILRARLQPYVDGHHEEFRKHVREEAHDLALLPVGTAMLHAIGCCPPLHTYLSSSLFNSYTPPLPILCIWCRPGGNRIFHNLCLVL